jgi:hypothetical protein
MNYDLEDKRDEEGHRSDQHYDRIHEKRPIRDGCCDPDREVEPHILSARYPTRGGSGRLERGATSSQFSVSVCSV